MFGGSLDLKRFGSLAGLIGIFEVYRQAAPDHHGRSFLVLGIDLVLKSGFEGSVANGDHMATCGTRQVASG